MAGRTRIQTAPRTGLMFDSSEIIGFIQQLDDAGGGQSISSVNRLSSAITVADDDLFIYQAADREGTWLDILTVVLSDDINITLDQPYLLYIDQDNFIIFELGVHGTTGIIASGRPNEYVVTRKYAARGGYTPGQSATLYTNTNTGNFPGASNTSDSATQFETISGTDYYALFRDGGSLNYFLFSQGAGGRTWAINDDISFRLPNGEIYSGYTVDAIRADGAENRLDSGTGDTVRVEFDQATIDEIQAAYPTSGASWFMDPDDLWFRDILIFNGSTFPAEEGIEVVDFLDFFQANSPASSQYNIPTGIGRVITDSEGDTERIVGGSFKYAAGDDLPFFSFLTSSEDDFENFETIRIRIYEDDVDQSTATPILDETIQAWLSLDSVIAAFSGGLTQDGFDAKANDSNQSSVITFVPQSIIDTLNNAAVSSETASYGIGSDTYYYLASDQIRIDKTSLVEVVGVNQVTSDSFTIEPSNEVSLTANIKIVDNKNIGEVYGTISPSFEIPLTEDIKREFNYPDVVGNQIIPGVANSVDVILDTDEATIGIGTLAVEDWDETSMDVRFQSGVPSLSDALGEKLMSGADLTNDELINRGLVDASGLATGVWNDLEFPYTMDHWVSSQFMTNFDAGYVPIFGDFGFDPDGRPRVPAGEVLELASVDYVSDNSTSYTDEFGVTTQAQHDHYVDLYGSNQGAYYGNQSPSSAGNVGWGGRNRLIGPTPYFGEVAQGGRLQGYITHPSTPMRVDQTYYAPTLKTIFDKIALIGNYTYSFVGDNNQDILSTMLEDVVVFKKGNEGLGITLKPDELVDEFGFVLQDAGEAGVEIDQGSRASDNPDEIHLQYRFGESGSVTQSFGDTANISNNNYIIPVDGNYEFEFTGSFDVTAEDLREPQYVDHEAIIFSGDPGTVLTSEWFDEIDEETNVYETGLRILGRIKIDRVKGIQTGNEDWSWNVTHSGNFIKGERIHAALVSTSHKGNKSVTATIGASVFRTTKTPLVWENKTYNLGLQFGEETAIDTLHTIIDRFNLVVVPDTERRNHFNFFQYYDWILSAPKNYQDPDTLGFTPRLDWSDKIDNTSIQYSSLFKDQEEVINFTAGESDDRISTETQESVNGKVYGSREFRYESNQTDGDKAIGDGAQALAVASMSVAGDISKTIQPDPYNGIPHLYEFDGEEAKSIETGLIIGYSKRVSLPRNFYFADGTDAVRGWVGDVRTISNINDDESLDLNFSKNYAYSINTDEVTDAFTMYHQQRIDQLYDPRNRKLTATVAFEPHEFLDIVGNETIHIEGNDWLINEITDFPLSEPGFANVEFVGYLNNFTTVFTEMKNRFVEDPGELWTTLVGVEIRPYDVVDGAEVVLPHAVKQSEYSFDTIGTAETPDPDEPGGIDAATVKVKDIVLTQATRYDFQGSSVRDNSADLTGVSVQYIDNADNTVTARITVTTQDSHLYHKLLIEPEVNALPTDAVNVTLNVAEISANSIPFGVVATPTLTEFGLPGGVVTFRVDFASERDSSENDYELLPDTFTDNTSSIPGLENVSYTDQGLGVRGIYNYTIPAGATSDIVITPTLNVAGNSQQIVGQATSTLDVLFLESGSGYSNVSLGRTQALFPPGIPGDQFTFDLAVTPDFGYYTLEGPWGSSVGTYVSAGDSIQDGDSVILRYTMTYPPVGTGQQTVFVSGANAIPETTPVTELASRLVTYNGSGDTHTTSEPGGDELFQGLVDQKLATGHPFTITPAEGQRFTSITQVNVTSSSGVSNLQKVLVGDSIVLKYDVDSVANTTQASGSITYTVSSVAEPHTLTINVIDDITGITVSQRSFSWGFSLGTTTVPEMTFTVESNNENRAFTSTGDIQAGVVGTDQESGTTASLEVSSISNGVLTCNVDAALTGTWERDIVMAIRLRPGTTIQGEGIPQYKQVTSAVISGVSSMVIAHDDPESTFTFTLNADGPWQIYGGTGEDAIGGGTIHTTPAQGIAGTFAVTMSFSGNSGTVFQQNNIIVRPLGGAFTIGSGDDSFYIYRSIITQSAYDSLQSNGSIPEVVKNSTFYITN